MWNLSPTPRVEWLSTNYSGFIMNALIRISLSSFIAAVFVLGAATTVLAQDTPQERQRARRATLSVYENIDGILRGLSRQYGEAHPGMSAEFVRSSYWRMNEQVYAIVKMRVEESVTDAEASSYMKMLMNDADAENVARSGNAITYDRYIYAAQREGDYALYASPDAFTADPEEQERALLEMKLAKRQEKFTGKK